MNDNCADMSFGLNAQALAVATLLAQREPDFADYEQHAYQVRIRTYPWYNGRERGVAFVVQKDWGPESVILAVAECRSSDGIFVEEWEQDLAPYNGPSLVERGEALGEAADTEVYKNRKTFNYGQIGKVADYVYGRMDRWYQAEKTRKARGNATPALGGNTTPLALVQAEGEQGS